MRLFGKSNTKIVEEYLKENGVENARAKSIASDIVKHSVFETAMENPMVQQFEGDQKKTALRAIAFSLSDTMAPDVKQKLDDGMKNLPSDQQIPFQVMVDAVNEIKIESSKRADDAINQAMGGITSSERTFEPSDRVPKDRTLIREQILEQAKMRLPEGQNGEKDLEFGLIQLVSSSTVTGVKNLLTDPASPESPSFSKTVQDNLVEGARASTKYDDAEATETTLLDDIVSAGRQAVTSMYEYAAEGANRVLSFFTGSIVEEKKAATAEAEVSVSAEGPAGAESPKAPEAAEVAPMDFESIANVSGDIKAWIGDSISRISPDYPQYDGQENFAELLDKFDTSSLSDNQREEFEELAAQYKKFESVSESVSLGLENTKDVEEKEKIEESAPIDSKPDAQINVGVDESEAEADANEDDEKYTDFTHREYNDDGSPKNLRDLNKIENPWERFFAALFSIVGASTGLVASIVKAPFKAISRAASEIKTGLMQTFGSQEFADKHSSDAVLKRKHQKFVKMNSAKRADIVKIDKKIESKQQKIRELTAKQEAGRDVSLFTRRDISKQIKKLETEIAGLNEKKAVKDHKVKIGQSREGELAQRLNYRDSKKELKKANKDKNSTTETLQAIEQKRDRFRQNIESASNQKNNFKHKLPEKEVKASKNAEMEKSDAQIKRSTSAQSVIDKKIAKKEAKKQELEQKITNLGNQMEHPKDYAKLQKKIAKVDLDIKKLEAEKNGRSVKVSEHVKKKDRIKAMPEGLKPRSFREAIRDVFKNNSEKAKKDIKKDDFQEGMKTNKSIQKDVDSQKASDKKTHKTELEGIKIVKDEIIKVKSKEKADAKAEAKQAKASEKAQKEFEKAVIKEEKTFAKLVGKLQDEVKSQVKQPNKWSSIQDKEHKSVKELKSDLEKVKKDLEKADKVISEIGTAILKNPNFSEEGARLIAQVHEVKEKAEPCKNKWEAVLADKEAEIAAKKAPVAPELPKPPVAPVEPKPTDLENDQSRKTGPKMSAGG